MYEDIKKLVPEILPKILDTARDSTKSSIEKDIALNKQTMYLFNKIEKIKKTIDRVADFNLETDKISATEYKELKQILNGLNFAGFQDYLDSLEGFTNYAEVLNKYPAIDTVYWDLPTDLYRITSNKIAKFKKMKNLNAIEKNIIDFVIKRLEIFLPLADKVTAMKDCVGKIEKDTKKKVREREIEQIKGKLDNKLTGILEEMAEFFRQKIEKSRVNYYTVRLENYDKSRIKKYSDIQEIEIFVNYPGYDLKENAFEMIIPRAKKDSEEIIQEFVAKMLYKLGGLVVNYPNVEVSYDGNFRRNWVSFKLSEDTHFSVENNIVTGASKYGVWFNRYPTTFHNVVIDGKKVDSPSELKVKKLLNAKITE